MLAALIQTNFSGREGMSNLEMDNEGIHRATRNDPHMHNTSCATCHKSSQECRSSKTLCLAGLHVVGQGRSRFSYERTVRCFIRNLRLGRRPLCAWCVPPRKAVPGLVVQFSSYRTLLKQLVAAL